MTPDQAGKAIADRFVSGAYTGRDSLALHISSAIQQALEEAARAAETSEVMCEHGCTDRIAAIIRALAKDKQ
jgi:hypothetical protein